MIEVAIAFLVAGLVVVGTIGVVAIYRQVRFHIDMQESINALDQTHEELQQRFSDALDRIEAVVVEQEAAQVESVEDSAHGRLSGSFQSLIEFDTEIVQKSLADMLPLHLRAIYLHACNAPRRRVVYHGLRGFEPDWLEASLPGNWRSSAWAQGVPQEEWQAIL
ncbi:hypothetical protein IIA16_04515, partial [bacterium]|nr:hypothetical protein [bacterium]